MRNTAVSHQSIVVGEIVGEINRPNFCFRRPPSLLLRHCHTHLNTCRRVLSTSSPHKLLCDKLRQKYALLCTRRFIRETFTSAQRDACSRLASERSRRRQDKKLKKPGCFYPNMLRRTTSWHTSPKHAIVVEYSRAFSNSERRTCLLCGASGGPSEACRSIQNLGDAVDVSCTFNMSNFTHPSINGGRGRAPSPRG